MEDLGQFQAFDTKATNSGEIYLFKTLETCLKFIVIYITLLVVFEISLYTQCGRFG